MFVLRGYQAAAVDFNRLIDQINAAQIPLQDFYGKKTVRPAAFRKVVHQREEPFDGTIRSYRRR